MYLIIKQWRLFALKHLHRYIINTIIYQKSNEVTYERKKI